MAGDGLHAEAVDEPLGTVTTRDGRAAGGSATIYWWQVATLAARVGALERELGEGRRDLERERRARQRVIERHEKLLADREAMIERLRAETTENGENDDGSLPSLPSR